MRTTVEAQSVKVNEVLEIVGNKGSVQLLKSGEVVKVTAQAGEKYRIVKKHGTSDVLADDVVATKVGDSLQLQYSDGTQISLEGFYSIEGTELALPANDGGIHAITSQSELATSDSSNFVYAHGNHDALMSMTQDNHSLQMAVAEHTSVSNLPHFAELATGVATDATAGGASAGGAAAGTAAAAGAAAGMSTAAMVGLGALGVAGVAVAAGGGEGGSSAPAAAADTTAPTITNITTNTAGQQIVLTFSEALNSGATLDVTKFALTVNGAAAVNPTTAVISGSTVTLTFAGATFVSNDTLTFSYDDPTNGTNNTNVIEDATGNDVADFTNSSALVADGYVRGAQIWFDTNNDGVKDINTGKTTDANGDFFVINPNNYSIIAVGGVNIDTGLPNTVNLSAPAGSTTINPLTTLVQAYIKANPTVNVTGASDAVRDALGLDASITNLTNYDPLAAGDAIGLAAQQAAAKVVTIISAATENGTATNTTTITNTIITNLITAIETANTNNTTTTIDSTTTLTGLTISGGIVTTINTAVTSIGTATTISDISTAQSTALDNITPTAPTTLDLVSASDLGSSTTDNLTSDATPTIRVSINTTATDGTAAVAGNTVDILDGSTNVGTATLTSTNIANGYVDITLSTLTEGSYTLTAKVTDAALLTSLASSVLSITVDTTAPAAPTLAEQGSTDLSANGMNTAEAVTTTFRATLATTGSVAVAGDTVELLIGGAAFGTPKTAILSGADITNGYVDFTVLAADLGADGAKSLTTKVTDISGNAGAASAAVAFTLDTTAEAGSDLAVAITAVALNGTSATTAEYTVTGLDTDATAVVTFDDGVNTPVTVNVSVNGTFTNANIAALAEGTITVTIVATDTAGNTANGTGDTVALDNAAPTLSSSTPADEATAVNIGGNIVLTFAENVLAGTGDIVISDGASDTRTISVSDTTQVTISGTTVTINPTLNLNASTAYNVQMASGVLTDTAGNAYAGITDVTTLNFTTDVPDVTAPNMVEASFTTGTNTVLTLTFDESVLLADPSAVYFYKNGTTLITPSATPTVSGSTITISFVGTWTATDFIKMNNTSGGVTDISGNALPSATVVAASSDNSTIDLSQVVLSSTNPIFGGNGNDIITGSSFVDYIRGGEGSDTIDSKWGADTINLEEITLVRDTVMMDNYGTSSSIYSTDIVLHFDTAGATATNDLLGVGVVQIIGATSGDVVGTTVGAITQHSIAGGIITFKDTNGAVIVINQSNVNDAVSYFMTNTAIFLDYDIVGFRMDTDASGTVDSTMIYQQHPWGIHSLIALAGITTATLGTTAGTDVIQIVDKIGTVPEDWSFGATNHQLELILDETITSTTINASTTNMYIGTNATRGTVFDGTISIVNGHKVVIDTGTNTMTTSDYLLIDNNSNSTFTDAAGNVSNFFDVGEAGIAIGNTATASIDLSGLSGGYAIVNSLTSANSTLIGTSGNNYIEDGSGDDTITAGAGADEIDGSGGNDTFIVHQGDSTAVVYHDNNSNGSVDNGDTYTFANGFDIIKLGSYTTGQAVTMQMDTAMMTGTLTAGAVADDNLALVRGWFNDQTSTFTVSSTSPAGTLVLYDGTSGTGVSQTATVVYGASGVMTIDDNTHTVNYVI